MTDALHEALKPKAVPISGYAHDLVEALRERLLPEYSMHTVRYGRTKITAIVAGLNLGDRYELELRILP